MARIETKMCPFWKSKCKRGRIIVVDIGDDEESDSKIKFECVHALNPGESTFECRLWVK